MRHSAIGRGMPGTARWPTECLKCGQAELAYQYEASDGDRYECQACYAVHSVFDRRDETGWHRAMRILEC